MTLQELTLQEYLATMSTLYLENRDHVRMGQAYMNYLCMVREDLYQKVTGTENDPFYLDMRLPKFFSWLAENWE